MPSLLFAVDGPLTTVVSLHTTVVKEKTLLETSSRLEATGNMRGWKLFLGLAKLFK